MDKQKEIRSTFKTSLLKGALGNKGIVLMDDGGSKMDTPDGVQHRQTWVAVLVPPSLVLEAVQMMDQLTILIKDRFGADELHAHEIFQQKGCWANASIGELKTVVGVISEILTQTRFPIVVQTFWKGNESHRRMVEMYGDRNISDHKRKLKIDIRKPKDAAFLFCLHRCKNYIEDKHPNTSWSVFADEGMSKPGATKSFPIPWVDGNPVKVGFEDSRVCQLIQLADFVAFFLNRSQQIHFSNNRSKHDEELLDILGAGLNFVNIQYETMKRVHPIEP